MSWPGLRLSEPACERDGITPCVPTNRAVNNQGDFFDRTAFRYEPQTDTFRCPAGRTLVRKQVLTRKRSILYVAEDCSDCALKPRCTRVERRFVRRHLYEDALERMNACVEADPGLMRRRRCTAEHIWNYQTNDSRRALPHQRSQ